MSRERRPFSFRRTFLRIMTVGVIVLWGIAHLPDTAVNVSSNLDGQAPMTTRTLDPKQAPTTTAHTLTSGPQRTTTTVERRPIDEFTIVVAGRAITIHRTLATAPLFAYLEGLQP